MRVFKDALGRDWAIEINLGAREVVKAKAGVDFLEEGGLGKMSDPLSMIDVLSILCQPQWSGRMSGDEFAAMLRGQVLETAAAALREELLDFFPSRRRTTPPIPKSFAIPTGRCGDWRQSPASIRYAA